VEVDLQETELVELRPSEQAQTPMHRVEDLVEANRNLQDKLEDREEAWDHQQPWEQEEVELLVKDLLVE
jgi:hypothetical protein